MIQMWSSVLLIDFRMEWVEDRKHLLNMLCETLTLRVTSKDVLIENAWSDYWVHYYFIVPKKVIPRTYITVARIAYVVYK